MARLATRAAVALALWLAAEPAAAGRIPIPFVCLPVPRAGIESEVLLPSLGVSETLPPGTCFPGEHRVVGEQDGTTYDVRASVEVEDLYTLRVRQEVTLGGLAPEEPVRMETDATAFFLIPGMGLEPRLVDWIADVRWSGDLEHFGARRGLGCFGGCGVVPPADPPRARRFTFLAFDPQGEARLGLLRSTESRLGTHSQEIWMRLWVAPEPLGLGAAGLVAALLAIVFGGGALRVRDRRHRGMHAKA